MDREKWFIIFTGLVCGCVVLLCVVVTYLCVVVRRIRRKLNNLSSGGSLVVENPGKLSPKNAAKNRTNSGNERYTRKPPTSQHRRKSHRHSYPDETVTVLEVKRATPTQNIVERPREPEPHMLITEFINIAYNPDTKRDSTRSSSSKSNDAQHHEEELPEQPIYQNKDEMDGEPVYQNTGELANINNPELMRCKTMDISQVS